MGEYGLISSFLSGVAVGVANLRQQKRFIMKLLRSEKCKNEKHSNGNNSNWKCFFFKQVNTTQLMLNYRCALSIAIERDCCGLGGAVVPLVLV